jgi:hypothetical protein
VEATLDAQQVRAKVGTQGPVTCERLEECIMETYAHIPISKLRAELHEVLQMAKEVNEEMGERITKLKRLFSSWTRGEELCRAQDLAPWLAAYHGHQGDQASLMQDASDMILMMGGGAGGSVRLHDMLSYYNGLIWDSDDGTFNTSVEHMVKADVEARDQIETKEKEAKEREREVKSLEASLNLEKSMGDRSDPPAAGGLIPRVGSRGELIRDLSVATLSR